MMRRLFLVLLPLLLCGCTQSTQSSFAAAFLSSPVPHVAIKPVEDRAKSPTSARASIALAEAVAARLNNRGGLNLVNKNEQFAVNMKLLQHEELPQTPPELAMSVQLEILDARFSPSVVILQEVISINTLLEKPLNDSRLIAFQDENFRISPLGLAHAKISREIAARIEDYVHLARKG